MSLTKKKKTTPVVDPLLCPKCGEVATMRSESPNGLMWMYSHRLPEDQWIIPGVPQGTTCIVPKKMNP